MSACHYKLIKHLALLASPWMSDWRGSPTKRGRNEHERFSLLSQLPSKDCFVPTTRSDRNSSSSSSNERPLICRSLLIGADGAQTAYVLPMTLETRRSCGVIFKSPGIRRCARTAQDTWRQHVGDRSRRSKIAIERVTFSRAAKIAARRLRRASTACVRASPME